MRAEKMPIAGHVFNQVHTIKIFVSVSSIARVFAESLVSHPFCSCALLERACWIGGFLFLTSAQKSAQACIHNTLVAPNRYCLWNPAFANLVATVDGLARFVHSFPPCCWWCWPCPWWCISWWRTCPQTTRWWPKAKSVWFWLFWVMLV